MAEVQVLKGLDELVEALESWGGCGCCAASADLYRYTGSDRSSDGNPVRDALRKFVRDNGGKVE